jgi:CRISPR-associated protein Cmx8
MSDRQSGESARTKKAPKMKARSKKATANRAGSNDVLKMRWELDELPSSQHRAGLAGLALCVAFLKRQSDRLGTCEIQDLDERGLTLVADRRGMQSLFDDVYDATVEETRSKSKWPGAEAKRVEEVEVKEDRSGKTKTEKRFVYDRVVPAGWLVRDWDAGASGAQKLWLKLWQELVWSTLRGVPATREPFNARAESRRIEDGSEAWDELSKSPNGTVELPSTYALGAQAKSAENVLFEDVTRFRFLLHFWPFVVATYVPAVLQRDGKREFVGYALAMPDIAILSDFVVVWEQVARGRGCEPLGYRPRDAVIDLAAEAGLDVVRRSNELVASRQGASATRAWLSAVDVFHVEKEGNNVRMRGIGRVVPQPRQDDEYARVRNGHYRSPLFRRQRIINVLEGKPWWWGYGQVCSTTPDEMTIRHDSFQHDCRAALTEVEMKQDVAETEQTLEHLIFRRVQAYVLGKTERKYELSWARAKGNPAQEKEYGEKREKVAREAFLAVRSRTGSDFVAYFTSTICSVPQHTSEATYLEIARALMNPKEIERVRSLTLLALSAVA